MKVKVLVVMGIIILTLFLVVFVRRLESNDYLTVIINHFTDLQDTSTREYITAREYQRVGKDLFYIDDQYKLVNRVDETEIVVQENVESFLVKDGYIYYTNHRGQLFSFDWKNGKGLERIEAGSRLMQIIGNIDDLLYVIDLNNLVITCFDMMEWKEIFSLNIKQVYKDDVEIISHSITKDHIILLANDGGLWNYNLAERELIQMEVPIETIEGVTHACIEEYNGNVLYSCYKNESEYLPSRYAKSEDESENGVYEYDFSDDSLKKRSDDSAMYILLLGGEIYLYDRGVAVGELRKMEAGHVSSGKRG